jgi:hypothetical protein
MVLRVEQGSGHRKNNLRYSTGNTAWTNNIVQYRLRLIVLFV